MWSWRQKPDARLLELFAASGRNVSHTSELLSAMLADYPETSEVQLEIAACEHEGDRIAHDILHRVAQESPRRATHDHADVHALVSALDDIVDYAEEAADQLGRYAVAAPMESAQALADVLVRAAREVELALHGLRGDVDAGTHLVQVHVLEDEADRIVRDAVASLFAHGIDPIVVIRWKDIFESLEAAVDACEAVANVLEGIGLKQHHRR